MDADQFRFERISNACRVILRINISDLKHKSHLEYKSPTYSFNSTSDRWAIELKLCPQVNQDGKYPCVITLRIDDRVNTLRKQVLWEYQIVISALGSSEIICFKLNTWLHHRLEKNLNFFNIADIIRWRIQGSTEIYFDVSSNDYSGIEKDANEVWRSLDMYSFASSGRFSDVTIKTKDREFKAHRLILAARSPVFKAMLSNDMKEAETGVISIDDVRPEVMEAMLYYIYNNETLMLPKVVLELFEVAHRYDMEDLLEKCKNYLELNLNTDVAVQVLQLAEKYELKALSYSAASFILKNEFKMVKHKEYIEYLLEHLNVDNVAEYLLKAHKYKLLDFENSLITFIDKNYKKVIQNSKYRRLYTTHTRLILSVDQHLSNLRN